MIQAKYTPLIEVERVVDGKIKIGWKPQRTGPAEGGHYHLTKGEVWEGARGFITGKPNGVCVIDFDPDKLPGGRKSLKQEMIRLGLLGFVTRVVRSGRNGYHYYFTLPEDLLDVVSNTNGDLLGAGVDFKAGITGDYVVAPGAELSDGRTWELVRDDEIAPLPEHLVEMLREWHVKRAAKRAAGAAARAAVAPKADDPPSCCVKLAAKTVQAILTDMDELSFLGYTDKEDAPNEVLDISGSIGPAGLGPEGEGVGWDLGYLYAAARLVEIAEWEWSDYDIEQAEADFMEHAPEADGGKYAGPEHKWQAGTLKAEAWQLGSIHRSKAHSTVPTVSTLPGVGSNPKADEDESPYSFSLNTEPYLFTEQFVDRHFTDQDQLLTLRYGNEDERFWLWSASESRYEPLKDGEVESIVSELLKHSEETAPDGEVKAVNLKPKNTRDVVVSLEQITRTSRHAKHGELLPVAGGVPFRNGWLDIRTGEVVPITPARDVKWSVAADYSPDAQCPMWEQFLKSCGFGVETDEYRLLRQWFGYVISGDTKKEKAMILMGSPRGGKGVTIRIAEALLGGGRGGVVATSIGELGNNAHSLEDFIGKGLAVIGEARFDNRSKNLVSTLLSLISNDTQSVNPKYKKIVSVNLKTRLMMATNVTPYFMETSDALAHRFMIIRYLVSHADNPDEDLYWRLLTELPGIANWALEGLADLEHEGKFTETASGAAIREDMIEIGSPTRTFIGECCEKGGEVLTGEVFAAYEWWCEKAGVKFPLPKNRFTRDLQDTYNWISTRKSGSVRYVSGITLNDKWSARVKGQGDD